MLTELLWGGCSSGGELSGRKSKHFRWFSDSSNTLHVLELHCPTPIEPSISRVRIELLQDSLVGCMGTDRWLARI